MLATIRPGHIRGQSDAACGETPTEYGRPIAVPVSRIRRALPSPEEYRWFRAPGRVNLMGDHTDYNGGLVLPIAIGLECVVAVRPRDDGEVSLRSLDVVEDDWTRYVDAVREVIAPARGVDGVLASSVPPGSGLSSSAALEVAVALALGGGALAPVELALACQRAEHLATGVPSGVMDQLASVAARADRALLIDCRSLELRYVRIPDDAAIVVVHSGVPRTLERSAYANVARRASESPLCSGSAHYATRPSTRFWTSRSPGTSSLRTREWSRLPPRSRSGTSVRVGELMLREPREPSRRLPRSPRRSSTYSSSCSSPQEHTAHA